MEDHAENKEEGQSVSPSKLHRFLILDLLLRKALTTARFSHSSQATRARAAGNPCRVKPKDPVCRYREFPGKMKYEQVGVDLSLMLQTGAAYLGLVLAGWMLLRLVQACIWLPAHLRAQEESQFGYEGEGEHSQRDAQGSHDKKMK